jgi:hypothetical protein
MEIWSSISTTECNPSERNTHLSRGSNLMHNSPSGRKVNECLGTLFTDVRLSCLVLHTCRMHITTHFFLFSTEVNECQSNPCHNGRCYDRFQSYMCRCYIGFYGKLCEHSKFLFITLLDHNFYLLMKAKLFSDLTENIRRKRLEMTNNSLYFEKIWQRIFLKATNNCSYKAKIL